LKNNGEFINIHVILVSSPQSFVIQMEDDIAELNKMMPQFQAHCNSSAKLTSLSDVQKSECYAVYDDDARKWIR
jgi:Tudor domain